jgi:hypothetical protein
MIYYINLHFFKTKILLLIYADYTISGHLFICQDLFTQEHLYLFQKYLDIIVHLV